MATGFWSSDKLTGSQTRYAHEGDAGLFWSSDKLTGSQTGNEAALAYAGFGAVTN